MAEGGGEFHNDDTDLISFRDDDKKDQANTTWSFQPDGASTPYREQYEMQTMMREHSGLPDTSYEETLLLGAQSQLQQSWDALTRLFPRASATDLETSYSKSGRLKVKKAGFGKKIYPLFTKDSKTGKDRVNPQLTKEIKESLGKSAEEFISQESSKIRERQRELEKERNDSQISQQNLRSKNEEIQNLDERLNKEQAKIDQLKENQGFGEETKRKEQLLKNLKKDLKTKQKEEKNFKKKMKTQEKTQEEIAQVQSSISEEERKRNAMEEKLNSTKTFDALKEQENHLQRLNEKDRAIIQDEMAASFDKEGAEERVAARNEELARLQAQITEREAAMPLRERVREIFKKYGVTVASIFLAAGITIGAVFGAITNALKAMGKQWLLRCPG